MEVLRQDPSKGGKWTGALARSPSGLPTEGWPRLEAVWLLLAEGGGGAEQAKGKAGHSLVLLIPLVTCGELWQGVFCLRFIF